MCTVHYLRCSEGILVVGQREEAKDELHPSIVDIDDLLDGWPYQSGVRASQVEVYIHLHEYADLGKYRYTSQEKSEAQDRCWAGVLIQITTREGGRGVEASQWQLSWSVLAAS